MRPSHTSRSPAAKSVKAGESAETFARLSNAMGETGKIKSGSQVESGKMDELMKSLKKDRDDRIEREKIDSERSDQRQTNENQ